MTKGIQIECQCCGTKQEATEYIAHDIFGFSLDQVQHILHDFREQVPWADAIIRREQINRDTRLAMQELLKRIANADASQFFVAVSDIRNFLLSIGASEQREVK